MDDTYYEDWPDKDIRDEIESERKYVKNPFKWPKSAFKEPDEIAAERILEEQCPTCRHARPRSPHDCRLRKGLLQKWPGITELAGKQPICKGWLQKPEK